MSWAEVPRSAEACQIIDILRRDAPSTVSVMLRGSMLEQRRPHPGADIDLIIAAPAGLHALSLRGLAPLGRPVDCIWLQPGAPTMAQTVFSVLAHTRSVHVCGPRLPQHPELVDRTFVMDHWLQYAPFQLPRILNSQGAVRVSQTKQLLRSIGLVHFLGSNTYSRDLPTCCRLAHQEGPEVGAAAVSLFAALSQTPAPPIDIHPLISWLRYTFYERAAARFGERI